MSHIRELSLAGRLAALAGAVSALASLIGFIPGVYRDAHHLVVQSNGQDFATLAIGLPVLAGGLVASARGSVRGRIVVLGALGFLLYTYSVYAFIGLVGPATILHISVVGFAAWAFIAAIASPDELPEAAAQDAIGERLLRRPTGVYVLVIAAFFAMAWLGQIASAAISGVRPQQLIDAGWPTSPIFTLDLAFVLPLCALTGWRLLTRRPGAYRLAGPLLVFATLIAIGVLSVTAFAILDGQALTSFDVALTVVFVVVAAIGAGLTVRALTPNRSIHESSPATVQP